MECCAYSVAEEHTPALKKIKQSADHVNEQVRRGENIERIRELEAAFITNPHFLSPSRLLLKRGPLLKKGSKGNSRYEFILFNDQLVYAKPFAGGKLRLHARIPLDRAFVITEQSSVQATVGDSDDNFLSAAVRTRGRSFFRRSRSPSSAHSGESLEFVINNSVKSFVVQAASPQDKQDWMTALQTAWEHQAATVRMSQSTAAAASVVRPKNRTRDVCVLCQRSFGLMRRKHCCEDCGRVVCSDCSQHRMQVARLLARGDDSLHRVCDRCHQKHESHEAEKATVSGDVGGHEESSVTDRSVAGTESTHSRHNSTAQMQLSREQALVQEAEKNFRRLQGAQLGLPPPTSAAAPAKPSKPKLRSTRFLRPPLRPPKLQRRESYSELQQLLDVTATSTTSRLSAATSVDSLGDDITEVRGGTPMKPFDSDSDSDTEVKHQRQQQQHSEKSSVSSGTPSVRVTVTNTSAPALPVPRRPRRPAPPAPRPGV
ncbi:MAG: hypothetical protein MHM6MM_002656 [Cercozoa sp. M6MM]